MTGQQVHTCGMTAITDIVSDEISRPALIVQTA